LKTKAKGQIIKDVARRGKYILIKTDNGTIIIHLGMSGVLKIADDKTPLLKHDHVDIVLANNIILRLNDPRRFGCVLWTDDDPYLHKLLINLAPEPLTAKFNSNYLYNKLQSRKAPIKNVIMDSKTVVGVGNIYASESLFISKINPQMEANKLSKDKVKILVSNIKKVLRASIKSGGTPLKDFAQADGKPGYFAQKLLVYGKKGEPCTMCKTKIAHVVIGQRATYYCPKCQKI
jgi:formamidopyrimidine-DNA glycosylase